MVTTQRIGTIRSQAPYRREARGKVHRLDGGGVVRERAASRYSQAPGESRRGEVHDFPCFGSREGHVLLNQPRPGSITKVAKCLVI